MSMDFKQKWNFISDIYYPPMNFTDACGEPMRESSIATVPCSSACAIICEASYIGGQFAGYNYIRGCIGKIARYGFNNMTIYKMGAERRAICHRVARSQLFRGHAYMEDQVTICVCYGDRCNSNRAAKSASCSRVVKISRNARLGKLLKLSEMGNDANSAMTSLFLDTT
ncbi:hypothetical protein D918_00953 [Trichuris suis]|nr:hypothetical protein D918_00953 [Trichuris suis]